MSLLRKLFFYLFLVAYLVLCPLTLLYARGWLFRPGTEHGMLQAGLIALSTVPSGASVYVEERRYTERTPTLLRDLLPGRYTIKLTLAGRQPWTQTVPVQDGQSTVLDHVLLVPQAWTSTVVLPARFTDLVPLPGTPFILLATGPRLAEFLVYDLKDARARPLLSEDSPWRDARLISSVTVPRSPALLVHARVRDAERWLRLELKAGETRVEEVTRLLPAAPDRIAWDPLKPDHLFTWQDGYVNRVDLGEQAVHPRWLERVRGIAPWGRAVYVLQDDGQVWRVDHELKDPVVLSGAVPVGRSLFGAPEAFEVQPLSKTLVALLGERGQLWLNGVPEPVVPDGVRGLERDPSRERALVWQQARLGVLEYAKSGAGDDRAASAPALAWIFNEGTSLEQAYWVYDGSHALVRDQDRVLLVEAAFHGAPHRYDVVRVKSHSAIFYAEETGLLYYLDPTTDQFCALEVLPKRTLFARPDRDALTPRPAPPT